jgi:hypothetical protein
LEDWLVIHTFYNGLLYNTMLTIDAAAGGALMNKPYADAYNLLKAWPKTTISGEANEQW